MPSINQASALPPPPPIEASLRRLAEIASELGASSAAREANELASRASCGRFYLACVGQFKRGKSTLLNALLGKPLLPTGIIPVTTVPTIVRYGHKTLARVMFRSGNSIDIDACNVSDYVSENANPENHKNVGAVELFFPSSLLASGMCLVDTPGLNSIFSLNTATTQEFIPHIDAAIVVVGVDPPIAAAELQLIQQIGEHVANLLIVMNKADKSATEECRVVETFTRQILEDTLHRPIGPIYEVSAEQHLTKRGPERDFPSLVAGIRQIIERSGPTLPLEAGSRGAVRIGHHLTAILASEENALCRPIEESESQIKCLRRTSLKAVDSLRSLDPLFAAEQKCLVKSLLKRRAVFLARVSPVVTGELCAELPKIPRRLGPFFRRDAMQLAIDTAERHILPWLKSEQAVAEQEYSAVAARFTGIAGDFLQNLVGPQDWRIAPTRQNFDYDALNENISFPSGFIFETYFRVARPASPVRYMADALLGFIHYFSTIQVDAQEFLQHLLEINSMRVHSDICDRLEKSRTKLQSEIRRILTEMLETAEHSLERANTAKRDGQVAIKERLSSLRVLRSEIECIVTVQPGRQPCVVCSPTSTTQECGRR